MSLLVCVFVSVCTATFPGVNNLQTVLQSNSYPAQINFTSGQPYPSFPADTTNGIPAGLPNKPFDIVAQSGIPGVSLSTIFSNPSHNFHQTQLKINGGAENGWVYWSTGKSATMGMGSAELTRCHSHRWLLPSVPHCATLTCSFGLSVCPSFQLL